MPNPGGPNMESRARKELLLASETRCLHGKCHVFLPRNFRPNNGGYFDPPGNPSSKGVERSPGFFITPLGGKKFHALFVSVRCTISANEFEWIPRHFLNSKLSSPNRKGLLTIGTTGSRRQIILFRDEGCDKSHPSMFWFLGLGLCGWRTLPSFGMMVDVWQG